MSNQINKGGKVFMNSKKLTALCVVFCFVIFAMAASAQKSPRGRSGRADDRRTVGKEVVKQSGKTTEDIRGVEGRQDTRRTVGKEVVKQSGKTKEDIRGVEGREEFRKDVGKAVYDESTKSE